MTTHPKREYAIGQISEMAARLRNKNASGLDCDDAADMLYELASQLAAQKREGEQSRKAFAFDALVAAGHVSAELAIASLALAPSPDQDREVLP
jgi:hypothetical protein